MRRMSSSKAARSHRRSLASTWFALETTCVMLDLTRKNIFATIAGKVWEFVKDKLVGVLSSGQKAWGDFSPGRKVLHGWIK